MAVANLYCDVANFRARYVNNLALDTADQSEIVAVLAAASRRVDDYCHRPFYSATETRIFDGPRRRHIGATSFLTMNSNSNLYAMAGNATYLRIPDCLAATVVALDENSDRTFELTLNASKDYYLLAEGADNPDTPPYNLLQLDTINGQRSFFSALPRLVSITGRWGYTENNEPISVTGTTTNATTATLTVSSATNDLAIGQTLLMGTEQMFVQAGSGTTWTVLRGVNGTTAATQTAGTTINRYTYLPEVHDAALILAGRMWKRRESAYSSLILGPGVGQMEIFKGMDADCADLLSQFQRVVI